MEYFKNNSVFVNKTRYMTEEELDGKITVGKLVERDRIEFTECLRSINQERREQPRSDE